MAMASQDVFYFEHIEILAFRVAVGYAIGTALSFFEAAVRDS